MYWSYTVLSETYFNQNQLRLHYRLSQTYIYNISIYCFDWRKSLDNLVLFLMCVCFIYICIFLTRKCSTMQHGNSSFFSQNSFPLRSQMTLRLWARTTITSRRFLRAGAMENVAYTRTVPHFIRSSGVPLSSSIRLFTGFYGIDSMGLGN